METKSLSQIVLLVLPSIDPSVLSQISYINQSRSIITRVNQVLYLFMWTDGQSIARSHPHTALNT